MQAAKNTAVVRQEAGESGDSNSQDMPLSELGETGRYPYGVDELARHLLTIQGVMQRQARWLSGLLLSVVVLSGVVTFQVFHHPEPEVLAMTQDGRILPLPTVDEPFYETANMLEWVERKLEKAYALDFVNLKGQIADWRTFMTAKTQENFKNALETAGILELVRNGRILTGKVNGETLLIKQGSHKDTAVWIIDTPMKLSFESSDSTERPITMNISVEVVVIRVPITANSEGREMARIRIAMQKNRGM